MYWLASFIFCWEMKNESTVEPQHNGKKKVAIVERWALEELVWKVWT